MSAVPRSEGRLLRLGITTEASLASSCSDLQDNFSRHLQSTETKVRCVRSNQCIFSSSWHASLKARSGSRNPWSINCLIPENVVFSLA